MRGSLYLNIQYSTGMLVVIGKKPWFFGKKEWHKKLQLIQEKVLEDGGEWAGGRNEVKDSDALKGIKSFIILGDGEIMYSIGAKTWVQFGPEFGMELEKVSVKDFLNGKFDVEDKRNCKEYRKI